jgi:hypothetical protein
MPNGQLSPPIQIDGHIIPIMPIGPMNWSAVSVVPELAKRVCDSAAAGRFVVFAGLDLGLGASPSVRGQGPAYIIRFRASSSSAILAMQGRGPKVATEMALSVLAYSLTRVINIVGIKPLIAAIGA